MIQPEYGIKIWSIDTGLLEDIERACREGLFQYAEISVIPGTISESFSSYQIPWVVHGVTDQFGLNIADPDSTENKRLLQISIEWADNLHAQLIVLHPGIGNIANACDFLSTIQENRICIENMPARGLHNELLVGAKPEEIISLIEGRFGFCFDINHAIKAAATYKVEYISFISKFSEIRPEIYHISDGDYQSEYDQHLSIGVGNYEFERIFAVLGINEGSRITLETPRSKTYGIVDDIENRNRLNWYFREFTRGHT